MPLNETLPPHGTLDYLRDPEEIYNRSLATVADEAGDDLDALAEDLRPVVLRLAHACGMVDVIVDLDASDGAATAGVRALRAGAPVLSDCAMLAHGVIRRLLPARNDVICRLHAPGLADKARRLGATRSAAAVDLWLPDLKGAVVAIGNAPTALYRLLELLDAGAPAPALIVGLPVGFVGAAESKRALAEMAGPVPYITVHGRRGGSAMAASIVNALGVEAGK